MVALFGGLGAALLFIAFQRMQTAWRTGLPLGCYWLLLKLTLDVLVLVPFTRMPISMYFYDIGRRYLLIPIVATATGAAAGEAAPRFKLGDVSRLEQSKFYL